MSESLPTAESLRADSGYRFNDNVTEDMSAADILPYLRQLAEEASQEAEISYGIYRELAWRYPDRPEVWDGLARFAAAFQLPHEERVAVAEAKRLRNFV